MSSAPAWPACRPPPSWRRAASRSPDRGGGAGGRALPLLFRCRHRRRDRQWQSSGAVRQSRGARLSGAHRRARTRWPGRRAPNSILSICASGERWTLAAQRRAAALVDHARGRRVPGTSAGDYLRLCQAAVGRPDKAASAISCPDRGRVVGTADAALSAGGAEHRAGRRFRARWPARCCARPWPRAAAPIARASPIPPWRRPSSIRRWHFCKAKGAHGAIWARGCAAMTFDRRACHGAGIARGHHAARRGDDAVVLAVPPWVAKDLVPGPDRAR